MSQLLEFLYLLWVKVRRFFSFKTNKPKTNKKIAEKETEDFKIPFVKGLPFVGTLFDLLAAGGAEQLHEYIDKRHQENGEIFSENLIGNQNTVFIASPSLIKSVFHYEGQCPKHPLPQAWVLYNKKYNQTRGLFFMEGKEWLNYRRLLNQFLLVGNLDWIKVYIETCSGNLIKRWESEMAFSSQRGLLEIKDIEFQLYRWSIEVICTIMFGPSFMKNTFIDESLNNFARIVRKIFDSSSALMSFPPYLAQLLHLNIWKRFENDVTQVLSEGATVINMLITSFNETEEVVSLYSKMRQADISLEITKRIFIDLIIAAGDTTAYSTEWALYLLAKDQDLQNKIMKEMISKEKNMPVLRGFVKETLRLYPVAPFIGRYIDSDAKLGEYFVKSGTLVIISLYTSGRDSRHFYDPLEVKPERWKSQTECHGQDILHQSHASIPFSIGNRSCIGRRIALYQIESIISLIINKFKLHCKNGTNIKPILRLVTVPSEPLKLVIMKHE